MGPASYSRVRRLSDRYERPNQRRLTHSRAVFPRCVFMEKLCEHLSALQPQRQHKKNKGKRKQGETVTMMKDEGRRDALGCCAFIHTESRANLLQHQFVVESLESIFIANLTVDYRTSFLSIGSHPQKPTTRRMDDATALGLFRTCFPESASTTSKVIVRSRARLWAGMGNIYEAAAAAIPVTTIIQRIIIRNSW